MFPMHGGFMGRRAQGALPYTPPLDAANAAAAYSIRKLRTAYNGPCMRVRNTTLGINTDVGFDANGYVDTAELLSLAAGFSLVTLIWYDQSGNDYHLQNPNGTIVPSIVLSGVLQVENGLAALIWLNNRLFVGGASSIWNFLHDGTTSSHYVVLRAGTNANPSDFQVIISTGGLQNANNGYVIRYRDASGVNDGIDVAVARGASPPAVFSSVQNVFTPNQQNILFITTDADNATAANRALCRVNDGVQFGNNANTALPSASDATTALAVGNATAQDLDGSMQELVVYDTDQSANETVLRNNANSYFSIF